MSRKRTTIIEVLGKLDCLNRGQQIQVVKMLANNNIDPEFFFNMPLDDRVQLDYMMLSVEIYNGWGVQSF